MNRVIQNNFTGGLLSNVLHGRTDLTKYANGLEECINFIPQPYGGIKSRPGTRYVGNIDGTPSVMRASRLIPFVFNSEQSYILVFSHGVMRIIKDGGFVVYPAGHINAGDVVEIGSPYATTDTVRRFRYTQLADVMYITHPSGAGVYSVKRFDHHDWSIDLVDMSSLTDVPAPANAGATFPTLDPEDPRREFSYIITSVTADGRESFLPALVSGVEVFNPWPADVVVELFWDSNVNIDTYNIYKSVTGPFGTHGLIGRTDGNSFVDDNIRPSGITRARMGSRPQGTNLAPTAIGLYEQRGFYGGSNNKPQTVYASQTGHVTRFANSTSVLDTDSLQFTLFSEMSERIMHFVGMDKLFIFTTESEKIMESGPNTAGITPTSVKVRTRSRLGCSHARPVVIGGDILFAQRSGRRVYNMFYSLESDGFDTNQLTMLVPDLFDSTEIREMAWDGGRSLLWLVTDDGRLFSLTYDRTQEVWAWAKHETDGFVASVAHIDTANGSETYIVTWRGTNLGNQTVQVEELVYGDRSDPKTSFCVDSGLSYSGDPVTTLSGLDHLVGREVAILADGGALNPQTVSSGGSITLENPASEVIIGLPFSCIARPTRLNVNAGSTTIQNMPKLISNVALRLINTRGISVSVPNNGRRTPIELKPRSDEAYADPSQLQNGDVRLATFGSWNRDGYIEIRQDNPLPAHITAMILEVELED